MIYYLFYMYIKNIFYKINLYKEIKGHESIWSNSIWSQFGEIWILSTYFLSEQNSIEQLKSDHSERVKDTIRCIDFIP